MIFADAINGLADIEFTDGTTRRIDIAHIWLADNGDVLRLETYDGWTHPWSNVIRFRWVVGQ